MMIRFAMIIVLVCYAGIINVQAAEYGVALAPTPVLNSPDFKAVFVGANGRMLKVDRCGQVRELEFIALPGTVFTIMKKINSGSNAIYQVETDEYAVPPRVKLYIDSRFVRLSHIAPQSRKKSLPPRGEVVAKLREAIGSSYVWGGNVKNGVPELSAWFYQDSMAGIDKQLALAGLDCSGLLYSTTGGWTPRNTSQLLAFGQGVVVAGKSPTEIVSTLQPLDLIVWNGHVIIVLDQQTAIESRLECGKPGQGGVVVTPLPTRIAEIMHARKPVNAWQGDGKRRDIFVVRRWYGI